MNEAQKKRSAGYFADISKIVFAAAVVAPLVSKGFVGLERLITIFLGVLSSAIFYLFALRFERSVKERENL